MKRSNLCSNINGNWNKFFLMKMFNFPIPLLLLSLSFILYSHIRLSCYTLLTFLLLKTIKDNRHFYDPKNTIHTNMKGKNTTWSKLVNAFFSSISTYSCRYVTCTLLCLFNQQQNWNIFSKWFHPSYRINTKKKSWCRLYCEIDIFAFKLIPEIQSAAG